MFFLAFLVSCGLISCGRTLEAPPVELLERESLVGAGKILQIKSTTNEELRAIEVTITAASGERRYSHERLGPYEYFEVGWKKLGGWEIPAEAEVEVRAEGFLLPFRARLTAGQSGS